MKKVPQPTWQPSDDIIANANITRLMRETHCQNYQDFHRFSVEQPEAFWALMFNTLNIQFEQRYQQFCDPSQGPEAADWLVGAKLNIVDSCLQHGADKPAIIFQAEGKALQQWTVGELANLMNQVANGLKQLDFKPGDAIAIDMPMTAESVAIYLGIIQFGAAVVAIADSFAPDEIATRLRISDAKAIFTQDVIARGNKTLPLYDKVRAADAPRAIVLAAKDQLSVELRADDLAWQDFLRSATILNTDENSEAVIPRHRPRDPEISNLSGSQGQSHRMTSEPSSLLSNSAFTSYKAAPLSPTNILFSSGTTGDPKAIPWTHITPIKAASDAHLHHDIHADDVVCWPTNLGWMMGPWLIYAALLNKATIALYDGAPLGEGFGHFVEASKTTMLGLVPSLVKAWRGSHCMEHLDWSAIKCFSSSGECSNAEDMQYLMDLADGRPIIEYCGGTEIGGAYITSTVIQAQAPATFTTPALGLDFVILDDEGKVHNNGEVALVAPSFGLSSHLLNRDHFDTYFKDMPKGPNGECLRRHGDHIEKLNDHCYRAHGRVDDTMNLGGIKTSSADIERVLMSLDDIKEVAAIAVPPPGGGPSQLVIYVVGDNPQQTDLESLKNSLQTAIREHLNPLFKIHTVKLIEALPRTASNKIMRRLLRDELTK